MNHTPGGCASPGLAGSHVPPRVRPLLLDASVGTAALDVTPGERLPHLTRIQLFAACEAVVELLVTDTFGAGAGSLMQLDVTGQFSGERLADHATAIAFLRQAPELLKAVAATGVDLEFDVDAAVIDDDGVTLAETAGTWRLSLRCRPAA